MSTEGNIVSEITGQLVSAPSFPACLACVSEFIIAMNKWVESGQMEGEEPGYFQMVDPAITIAPSWQQQIVNGQMALACVALPTCMRHLGVREPTPMEKAAASGLLVPSPQNGRGM